MKEIFSVNSQHANGIVKKDAMSWAESKEVGAEAGQNRKIEPRSTGVDRLGLKVSHHLCIT